jgi:hypothetical protein
MPRAILSTQHVWVGAFTVGLSQEDAAGVADAKDQVALYATPVDIIDVYCGQCRRPYTEVAEEQCTAAGSTEHLRGGPEHGARRKRRCDRHQMLYKDCESLHDEPLTYGRPPMPSLRQAT